MSYDSISIPNKGDHLEEVRTLKPDRNVVDHYAIQVRNPSCMTIMRSEERWWLPETLLFEATSLSCMTDVRSEMRVRFSELYVRIKKEPPKQKMNQEPKAMLRFLRILGGTVALSPFHNCTPAKATPSTPETTKSAMILPIRGQPNRTMLLKGL